jgi:hypothetical protein
MKRLGVLGIAIAVLSLASCAGGIPVRVTRPAAIDLAGIKRIAVIPFGHAGDGVDGSRLDAALRRVSPNYRYADEGERQVAVAVVNGLTGILRRSKEFSIVKASDLSASEAGGGDASSMADAFVTGEVSVAECSEESWVKTGTASDGSAVGINYVERKVSFEFTYRVVRVSDGSVLVQESKSGSASYSGPKSSAKDAYALAQEIVDSARPSIARQIAPYTVVERRYLEADKSDDPRMKEAAKLAGKAEYARALAAYDEVYADSGNYAAGYDAAIVAELLGDLDGAIARMEGMVGKGSGDKAAAELARMERRKADDERLEAGRR